MYNRHIGLTDSLKYQNSKVLRTLGKVQKNLGLANFHTYRSRCVTDGKNRKTQNCIYRSIEEKYRKSVLFSITGKGLIEFRRGL